MGRSSQRVSRACFQRETLLTMDSELVVKVVNAKDMTKVIYLREQPRPVKHVTFDKSGSILTASCTDGVVYVYSLSSEQPELIKKVEGLIKSLETEAEASSKAFWYPDGRAFGAATATRDFQVMSRNGWNSEFAFKDGHLSDITAAAWSPNGALLVTTSVDRKMCLWDTRQRKVLKSYDDVRATILDMQWHPKDNTLSYTNNDGELYIHTDFVPDDHEAVLKQALQPAPLMNDPLRETSGNARRSLTNGLKNGHQHRPARDGTPDSLDEIFGQANDDDNFILDDDGAGYAEPNLRKRKNILVDDLDSRPAKRSSYSTWEPEIHEPFQPGSTPWRGNRRYLCLNLVGVVWTVDQDTHNTVTVEFYDREFARDFHFTDAFRYDKACLNEHGTLFSCPPLPNEPAQIFYRPHQTWTARTEWRTQLPPGESVTAIALSESYIVALTSANYVRVYTLFGTPFRIYRSKSHPTVTCAAWRDYVLTIGNGAVASDGTTQLVYTLENVKRDDVCQSEDVVALAPDAELQSIFFSDSGDPCIFDSSGVLSVLMHWRTPGQARWVPLLDTTQLDRLAGGRKEESYWPVAVAQSRFHCIILKGGDRYPYFPRPLLSDFEFRIPVSTRPPKASSDEDEDMENGAQTNGASEAQKLEHSYVLNSTLHSLLEDVVANTRATHGQKNELTRREVEVDKALLQLLAIECREGEDRGMKALELVMLMRDRSGRMLEAAQKVASRFGRDVLGEKIREVAERRMVGLDDDNEGMDV
jgi:chromosome transmission fidelity protein 4